MNVALDPAPATRSARKTFIRATEVWLPDGQDTLRLGSGVYGELQAFAEVSGEETFRYAEGLPGRAWSERRPIVLKGFQGTYFKRTEAAQSAGLTAAAALPVFDGEALKGVLVFLFGDDADHIGAVEVWAASGQTDGALALEDGYFGAARHFEWIARHTRFPVGQGLPGSVLKAGGAMLFRDLGAGYRFVRAESAADAGLTNGLGIPGPAFAGKSYVVTLLSALGAPIARRFEIWARRPEGDFVLRDEIDADGAAAAAGAPPCFAPGEGALGTVAASGAPLATSGLDASGAGPGELRGAAAGYGTLIACPIYRGGALAEIAAWYL